MENVKKTKEKKMTVGKAICAVTFLALSLVWSLKWGTGLSHIPLITSTAFAMFLAVSSGCSLKDMEKGMVRTINTASQVFVILMIVGILIALWMLSGVVPTMIYYGLLIISPSFFLPTAIILCGVVAMCVGSSWTTMSTVGIALYGISMGLGISPMITVGAIVSGSYFGDKMSPLSDTTNLASAIAGTDLFEHIKHMVYTSGVSFTLAIIFFFILGTKHSAGSSSMEEVQLITSTLQENYVISPLLIIPVLVVVVLAVKKVPAITTLMIGAIIGAAVAMVVQGSDLYTVVDTAHYGNVSTTGVELVDNLLSRGGLDSMMYQVSLIICAMMFGGVLESSGMLQILADEMLKLIHTKGGLITATILTSFGTNVVTGDQALAIILPGKIFNSMYLNFNLKPKNLSRCLEDAGTITSPLIPWNVCGAFVFGVFGVPTLAYVPFAFFNYINPIVSIIYGYTGFTIEQFKEGEKEEFLAQQL
ncbi:Na+/H+ antiporter NhaC [Anaerovorax sp. IOR16]|uniref:Na+/H+ antiporter NhaC n=1 Tax=Anaerovorax sp. IOR16 TaxID=2773458 RepID=UPI0019D0AF87|nr:Na+/H+ antiporter NhaC [Anaerovorax sp. IOR16]